MDQQYEVHKVVGKKYQILVKVLGQGQYARTFLAKNTQNGATLACKVIDIFDQEVISKEAIVQQLSSIENKQVQEQKKNKIMQRLQSEVDNTSKMSHINVVKFEDLVESQNNIYFFMEYCSGGTLEALLKQKRKFSEAEAIPIFRGLVAGCCYLYEKSVIHRDLKPSNVLFGADGNVKIADFGLSKAMSDEVKDLELSQTPWIGTPLYMSPQVIGQEPYSIKADVWSLGCIFYEMLFGRTPWYNDKVGVLQKMILEDNVSFPSEPKISSGLKNLIQMMLDKDENSRVSIQQVKQAIG